MALRKGRGCLTAFLIFVGVLVILAVLAFVFVPGLLRPYDLGVKTSQQSYDSFLNKLSLTKDTAPKSGVPKDYKIKYGKPVRVNKFLSNEEITSFINYNRPDYYALKNFQIRVNPDNSIETCGTLSTEYIFSKILSGKYDGDDAKKVMPMLVLIPSDVNIYFKLDAKVTNNSLSTLSFDKVGIMGIPIPESLVNSGEAISFVKENIGRYISTTNKESGSRYDLIQAKNEGLQFKGLIPSSVSHIKLN